MLDCLSSCEGERLFHDFELSYIVADYRNKQITIQLKSPRLSQNIHELKLFGVQYFQSSMYVSLLQMNISSMGLRSSRNFLIRDTYLVQ